MIEQCEQLIISHKNINCQFAGKFCLLFLIIIYSNIRALEHFQKITQTREHKPKNKYAMYDFLQCL